MTTLDSISELISKDHGLAVVSTLRVPTGHPGLAGQRRGAAAPADG